MEEGKRNYFHLSEEERGKNRFLLSILTKKGGKEKEYSSLPEEREGA